MTDYGLQIYNNNNVLIIDSTYKNHIYHAHGTSFVQQYLTEIDIPDLTSTGMIFIKPTSFYTLAYGFVKNGSVYDKILIASDSTGYVDWIVYEDIQPPSTDDYGLNVFDSTGDIVFSSNEKGYLNVVNDGLYSQLPLTVEDADNHYFCVVGAGLGYNINIGYGGGFKTVTYTRRIIGIQYIDSNTIDFDYFTYNVEEVKTASGGSGGFLSVGAHTSVPQRYIEIKPPPSI